MAQFTGMDVEAVRGLAKQMQSSADQIRDLARRLTSALESTQWVGPDRERFVSEWQGQYLTSLNQVADGLRETAGRADKNANEQETASA